MAAVVAGERSIRPLGNIGYGCPFGAIAPGFAALPPDAAAAGVAAFGLGVCAPLAAKYCWINC